MPFTLLSIICWSCAEVVDRPLHFSKKPSALSQPVLSAAYAQAGKPEAAREIANKKWRDDWRYEWSGYTYGTDLRDRSLMLETFTAIGDTKRAESLVQA